MININTNLADFAGSSQCVCICAGDLCWCSLALARSSGGRGLDDGRSTIGGGAGSCSVFNDGWLRSIPKYSYTIKNISNKSNVANS